jgi:hypothetical protein
MKPKKQWSMVSMPATGTYTTKNSVITFQWLYTARNGQRIKQKSTARLIKNGFTVPPALVHITFSHPVKNLRYVKVP